MFAEGLTELDVDSPWSYLAALVLPAVDVLLPIIPSEAAVITLGVSTSSTTDPRSLLLVALAALGAFVGDNVSYLVGNRFGPAAERKFLGGDRGRRSKRWAERALERHGTQLIVICRFVPGGRTAVTLTCGLTGYPRSKFVPTTAFAGALWAIYCFGIGRFGGSAFKDNELAALGLAFGIALAVSGLVELVRWAARRQHRVPADDRI